MQRSLTTAIAASAAVLALAVAVVPTVVLGQGRESTFAARLTGFQETPSLISDTKASFSATVDDKGSTISYRLSYGSFSTPLLFAHIHLGERGVAGGVAAFLCGGGGKPTCPVGPTTVTGTIVVADVVGPTAQGLTAGDFASLVRAARAGVTYANIHTMKFPGGEIRGQLGREVDVQQDERE
jgi:hypothetical protein